MVQYLYATVIDIVKNFCVIHVHTCLNFSDHMFTVAMLDNSLVKKLKDGLDRESTPKQEVGNTYVQCDMT